MLLAFNMSVTALTITVNPDGRLSGPKYGKEKILPPPEYMLGGTYKA
jgi:hypothetical protein